MIDLGTVRPGKTLNIPFSTYDSNDPSASVTVTSLVAGDIEIYKDGSLTQRASDSGYVVDVDLDTTVGVHSIQIDLADNTTAGFFSAGSEYVVVVGPMTVDAATINFVLARFTIGYADAVINTTIATLASQTSFTLTSGPAEADALNGCVVCIHDVASAVQLGFAVISDYDVTTKTVTLTAGVTFTAATTDNISIFPPSAARWLGSIAQTGDGTELTVITTDTEAVLVDTEAVITDTEAILTDTEAATAVLTDTEAILSDTELVLTDTEAAITERSTLLTDTEASQVAETAILADTELVLTDTEAAITERSTILTDTEAILTDTGTTIPATITTMQNDLDIITDSDGVILGAAGVDLVWDEVLTGATHNVVSSAGRRLRAIDAAFEVHSGTAQAGSTSTTFVMDTGADGTNDNIYRGDRIVVTAGTGVGEHGIIISYTASSRTATMSEAWVVTPDNTSEFTVVPADVDVETWNHNAVTGDGDWAEMQTDLDAVLVDTEAATGVITDTEAIIADTEAVLVDTEASQTAESSILTDTEAAITERATLLTDTEASQTAETSILADTELVLTDTEAAITERSTLLTDTEAIVLDTAEIGTAGAGLTDLGAMSTAMKAEILVEVNAALDTAISELGVAAPTATPTIRTGLMLLYMALRNKTVVQTSGTDALEIYNNAGTKIASKLLTDDGSDYTEAEMA